MTNRMNFRMTTIANRTVKHAKGRACRHGDRFLRQRSAIQAAQMAAISPPTVF